MTISKSLIVENEISKPFLRWAGGKRWLLKNIKSFLPTSGFNNYHEPFLGGASVYLFLNPKKAFLSDFNNELIQTYSEVKNNVEEVIEALKSFTNTKDSYYIIRSTQFSSKIENAAKFIYLNQTSFNGIYRVNFKGEYNVPYGFRNKEFLDAKNLRLVSKSLANADLFSGDFESIIDNIKEKDLIFLDPPYTVSHNLNGFIKYNQKLFSLEDQYRLSNFINTIKEKGAYYILTNAAHDEVKKIFDKKDKIFELSRANLIGGLKAQRGQTTEYVFTNTI